MKKSKFRRTIRRVVLVVLAVTLITVLSVYFIDQYSGVKASFYNKYTDEFWEELDGFVHYTEYEENANKNKIGNASYQKPYLSSDPLETKVESVRYEEERKVLDNEIVALLTPLQTRLASLKIQKENAEAEGNEELVASLTQQIQNVNIEIGQLETNRNNLSNRELVKWDIYFSETLLGFQLVMENDGYEFWLNIALTTFKVVEKTTGNVWYSNPTTTDSPALERVQKNILILYAGKMAGSNITYGNYDYSVSTVDTSSRNVVPDFQVKIDSETNTVIVWYVLRNRSINHTYFPQYISVERLNFLMDRNKEKYENGDLASDGSAVQWIKDTAVWYDRYGDPTNNLTEHYAKLTQSYYQLIKADSPENTLNKDFDYYAYKGTFSSMSELVSSNLYKWLYEWSDYDEDDLYVDNAMFDIDREVDDNIYKIAIEYMLTDEGINISIPGNSLQEDGKYNIVNIDILPYFTATKKGIEGYTVIPDGSGAIMNHDNGKTQYASYAKRIYTTDLAITSETKTTSTNDIMFPMYAVINTDSANRSGVLVEVMRNAAQMQLNADVSGRGGLGETNNTNYFRAYIRESQHVYIGTYSKTPVIKYTSIANTEDIEINYKFLTDDELSYSAVAKKYRDILIDRYNIEVKDETTNPVLDLEVIGAYSFKNNFLGIGYTDTDTLTTFAQLEEMIKEYQKIGVENINVFYYGWRDSALVDKTFKKMKISNLLGSKSDLKKLTEDYSKVTIYPYLKMTEVNEYQESFGRSHYNARNVIGEIQQKYPYNYQSNLFDTTKKVINCASPRYYYAFTQSLVDSYIYLFGTNSSKANAIKLNSLAIENMGSNLAGDYRKKSEYFKSNSVNEQIRSMKYLYDSGINDLALYSPYDYALQFTTHGRNIPMETTKYEIIDSSIPFYQLVVNGIFDYSGSSINRNTSDALSIQLMRLIETGSNPIFTFTYEDSHKLIHTDYNEYFNTLYSEWLTDVTKIYNELKMTGIYGSELVEHQIYEPNVYIVTYKSAGETIKFILNYKIIPANVVVDGIEYNNVPANSYKRIVS